MFDWLRKSKSGSKSKRKSTKSGKSAASKSEPRFGWAEAKPYLVVAAWVIALSGGAITWAMNRPRLLDYVADRHQPRIEVHFVDDLPPVEQLEERLIDRVRVAFQNSDPFDTETLAAIHASMVGSAWFDPETVRIERDLAPAKGEPDTRDGAVVERITIHGSFRRPFAFVRSGDSDMLVDREGYRLPMSYAAGEVDQLLVIRGAKASPPHAGERWRGPDIHNGLELVAYLLDQNRPWLEQVRAVDVSNADGVDRLRARLELITDLDRRVAWGRAVGDEAGIDIPPHQKIMLLDDQYESFGGRIDHPQGTVRVNLQLKSIDHGG